MIIKDIPDELKERYEKWKEVRNNWLTYANQCYELYMQDVEGTKSIYTINQLEKIKNKTEVDVSINHIFKLTNTLLAILTSRKPSHRVVTLDGRNKEVAQVLDKIKQFVLQNATYFVSTDTIRSMIVKGIGHHFVGEDDYFSTGDFGLKVKSLKCEDVILDPNSSEETNRDMEGFFIEREFTLTKLIQIYGHLFNNLINEDGSPATLEQLGNFFASTFATQYNKVEVSSGKNFAKMSIISREYYDKVYTTMYLIKDVNLGTYQKVFLENYEDQEIGSILIKGAEDQRPGIYVRRTIMFGDKIVSEIILPITEYPLINKYFEFSGRPYKSYGIVHFVKSMQEAYNKTIQNFILNGILTNNAGYKSPKGGIDNNDRANWEQHGNDPTVIKEYNPIAIDGKVLAPERDVPQQLPNFYPMFMNQLGNDMENISGINAIIQGNAKEANVDVFASLNQYQTLAMQRILMTIQKINEYEVLLGRVVVEGICSTLKPEQYIMFFDDKGESNELTISKELVKDLYLGKYTVVAIPSEMLPSQRQAIASELFKVAQSSPDPVERSAFISKAIELTDITGSQELLQNIDVAKKYASQLEQAQTELKRQGEINKQLENRVVNAEIKVRVVEGAHNALDSITTSQANVEKDQEIDVLTRRIKELEGQNNNISEE